MRGRVEFHPRAGGYGGRQYRKYGGILLEGSVLPQRAFKFSIRLAEFFDNRTLMPRRICKNFELRKCPGKLSSNCIKTAGRILEKRCKFCAECKNFRQNRALKENFTLNGLTFLCFIDKIKKV